MAQEIISRCQKDQCSMNRLSSLSSLDISGRRLKFVSKDDFKVCPKLKDLDLSDNNIREMPTNLNLPLLEELDCSDNDLSDISFITQFPLLKTFYISGNPNIKVADKYIAAALCPLLEEVDIGVSDHDLQKSVAKITDKLKFNVESLWMALYADEYPSGISGVSRETLREEFLCSILSQKDNLVFVVPAMKKFDTFMVMIDYNIQYIFIHYGLHRK